MPTHMATFNRNKNSFFFKCYFMSKYRKFLESHEMQTYCLVIHILIYIYSEKKSVELYKGRQHCAAL